jgi:hypothetical protein
LKENTALVYQKDQFPCAPEYNHGADHAICFTAAAVRLPRGQKDSGYPIAISLLEEYSRDVAPRDKVRTCLPHSTATGVRGGGTVFVGIPPAAAGEQDQDWLVILRKS